MKWVIHGLFFCLPNIGFLKHTNSFFLPLSVPPADTAPILYKAEGAVLKGLQN